MAPKPAAKVNPGGPMVRVARTPAKAKPKRYTAKQAAQYNALKKKYPFTSGYKAPAKPKRAAAGLVTGGFWITGANDEQPSCVATAIANSLLAATRVRATEEQVMILHRHAGGGDGVSISDALASVMQSGLAGYKPAAYWVTDKLTEATIVGMSDGVNDHAVTRFGDYLISWGAAMDRGAAEGWYLDGEMWHIRW
jgi:hypothetical protein